MICRNYLKLCVFSALALFLCGCPQKSAQDRPAKGRWASQDSAADTGSEAGEEHSGSPSPAGSPGGKSPGRTDSENTEAEDGDQATTAPPAAEDEDTDAGDEDSAPEEDVEEDSAEDTEPAPAPVDPPAPAPAQPDLDGKWLPLFGRGPQGVKPELWKSGGHVLISGNASSLEITPGGGSSFDTKMPRKLSNVRLNRSGPFLVVDQGNAGRTAYLRLDTAGGELAESGQITGRIGGGQLSGSFRLSSGSLKIDMDDGSSFSGKSAGGAWCGFLESSRGRGYCVLAMTGNGSLTGILFVDPYMSFETNLSFEVVQ